MKNILMNKIIFNPYRLDAMLEAEEAAEAARLRREGPRNYLAGLGEELARLCGRKRCVFASSGRAALKAGLSALGAGRGKTVALNNLTHHSLLKAVTGSGARPMPVEVRLNNLNPDHRAIQKSAKNADIVLLAHMFASSSGPAAIKASCRERGAKLLEDASQSIGLRHSGKPLGSFGDISVLSLSPYKPVSKRGIKAGALLFDDDAHSGTLVRLPHPPGLEIAAPMLRVKLKRLPLILEDLKRSNAAFRKRLAAIPELRLPDTGMAAQEIPIFVEKGTVPALAAFLEKAGFSPERKYAPFHEALGLDAGAFPVSSLYSATALHLPVYCKMTGSEINYACNAIERFFKNRRP